MTKSVNKICILGNIGHTPSVRNTKNKTEVASFSVATSVAYKDKQTNEWKDKTTWHNVVSYSEHFINVIKGLSKGSRVYLEGEMNYREYEDKDKVKQKAAEILLSGFGHTLMPLDKKDKDSQPSGNSGESEFEPDDMPF